MLWNTTESVSQILCDPSPRWYEDSIVSIRFGMRRAIKLRRNVDQRIGFAVDDIHAGYRPLFSYGHIRIDGKWIEVCLDVPRLTWFSRDPQLRWWIVVLNRGGDGQCREERSLDISKTNSVAHVQQRDHVLHRGVCIWK